MAQTSIRLLHLALLYAILCYLGVELALTLRDLRENDSSSLPATSAPHSQSSPASQIPFLGVTVALEQYNTPHDRQQALTRLHNAGFGWVRQRVDWSRIEPQPGDFQWAWTDQVLTEIAAAGLVPVIVLEGSPTWARDSVDRPPPGISENDLPWRLAPPAAPETFARFAAAFARRYQNIVRFYQIWDEPNIALHWGNRLIDPVGYARLLRAAAVAVRDADPDSVILAAALAPTQDRGHTAIDEGFFLQRLYAAGAAPYFDAVLVQPFGFGNRVRRSPQPRRRAQLPSRCLGTARDGRRRRCTDAHLGRPFRLESASARPLEDRIIGRSATSYRGGHPVCAGKLAVAGSNGLAGRSTGRTPVRSNVGLLPRHT